LTEYSNLSDAEMEKMEMAAVTVKMAKVTEMAAAVMTIAAEAVADVTDRKGSGRRHIRENTGL
jgi:hypothetical protein